MADTPIDNEGLVAGLPVGIVRMDANGRCTYANQLAADLTGLTREDILASGWEQCLHVDDRDTVLLRLRGARQSRTPAHVECRAILPDGRFRWLLAQLVAEAGAQNSPAGFLVTLTDTTHVHETLRASEERFRLAAQNARVGVLDYDVISDRGQWSPEVWSLLGLDPGGFTTLPEQLDYVDSDDRARIEVAMAACQDPAGTGTYAEELRIRRADTGEVRWVATRGQTTFEGTGADRRAVRFTGIMTDVTDRKIREKRDEFLLGLSDVLRPLNDALERQEVSVRLLAEHLQVSGALYADIDGDDFVVRQSYARDVAPLVGRGPLAFFGHAMLEIYRLGEAVVVANVLTDSRLTDSERAALGAREIAAYAGVMMRAEGRWGGGLGVLNATPRSWRSDEIDLIREVAERTWEGVERARAEAALREREQRLRLALEASAGGSWTLDVRTNQLDWDEGFRARYGFAPDEPAVSETWLSRVHDEDREQVVALLDRVRRTPTMYAWDNTFRIVRPDGTVSWFQSLGRADRNAAGEVTRLTGLDLDITERRKAEQAQQARRDEEHDRELRRLIETASQGIVSVDANGGVVMANRALEAMFGWAHGELVGQSIERLVPAADRNVHIHHRSQYFSAPRPGPMGVSTAFFGQRRDGTTFPIEVSLNHVVTPGGGQAIAFVTDITARKQADAVLQDRTVELERRTAQLSRLASDLTLAEQHAREQLAGTLHDGLQQLLVSAALNVERQVKRDAQQGAPESDLLQHAKRHLDEAVSAARSLSFDLFPPVLHTSGLPDALKWLAERIRQQYGLAVEVSADPRANSDRKDVRTLLFESARELLFNAVKHAHADRARVELTLDAGDALCISVADEGIGFDPAEVAQRMKAGEIGWGLFSIRERLTLLGGRFDIDSVPGRGTRFRLIAPRSTAPAGVIGAPLKSAANRSAVEDFEAGRSVQPLRIVIVDDHAVVRETFRDLLQERPELRVIGIAANGLEAIAAARELRPDVMLMDVSMPEMDGIEATRRIKAECPAIQIVGLSTSPRSQEPHAIELAGATSFFTKGVETQRLIEHLLVVRAAMAIGSVG